MHNNRPGIDPWSNSLVNDLNCDPRYVTPERLRYLQENDIPRHSPLGTLFLNLLAIAVLLAFVAVVAAVVWAFLYGTYIIFKEDRRGVTPGKVVITIFWLLVFLRAAQIFHCWPMAGG